MGRRLQGDLRKRVGGRRLALEHLESRQLMDASGLRITEFMASNDNTLTDYDGDSSDWLEIYNSGSATADLSGMYLTDNDENLTKWQFPTGVTLGPGGYLVVFASSKNSVKPNGELHTNFALGAGGEFLALVDPALNVIDAYAPEFPPQFEDVSYGRAMTSTGVTTTLVAYGASARAWVPTNSSVDETWMNVEFSDPSFNIRGATGFGYENNPGAGDNYTDLIRTTVPSFTTSLYLRVPFTLTTLAGIDALTLRMKFDDGFVAYVNGVPVAEFNAPEAVQWNSQATTNHPDNEARQWKEFDASAAIAHLRTGSNVLAIHALNRQFSSDMVIVPELAAQGAAISVPESIGFFETPTPGHGNPAETFGGFVEAPTMNVPHGFYDAPQSVTIASSTPEAIVVYTTDGSTPEVDAALNPINGVTATGPIVVSQTTNLRARAFRQDFKPSFVTTTTYVFWTTCCSSRRKARLRRDGPRAASTGRSWITALIRRSSPCMAPMRSKNRCWACRRSPSPPICPICSIRRPAST